MTHEKELFDFIGHNLHELAWRNDLPLNPSIAIWSFLEAFADNGFKFSIKDNYVTFEYKYLFTGYDEYNDKFEGHICEFDDFITKISIDKILTGWDRFPKGNPKSLYDSIHIIFDDIKEYIIKRNGIEDTLAYWNNKDISAKDKIKLAEWSNVRNNYPRKIRQTMEDHLVQYFNKYHEHMFIPLSHTIPKLEEPKLFHKALERFPMKLYLDAKNNNLAPGGPCSEYILEIDPEEYDETYHPSESGMLDYFWGIYLDELVKEKGYPLYYPADNNDEQLKRLIANGWNGIRNGQSIWKDKIIHYIQTT
ncbi:hypothetical protein ACFL1H_01185 [Nanoarchaeota archaeon]